MTTTAPQAQQTTNGDKANGDKGALKPRTRMDVLREGFERCRATLRAILPKHIDPDRVVKIALHVYMNKPELHSCTTESMVRSTLQCAELGLDPSPLLQEVAFVPFKNKRKVKDGNVFKEVEVPEVQMMPMYLGLIKLAKQTGEISDIYAVEVDESEASDEYFRVERGTTNTIFHRQRFDKERKNVLFAAYSVVKFKDGTHHFEVMGRSQIDAIRERSKAKDNGPWVTDYTEMGKKTVLRRNMKTVPKSPEKPLAAAIQADTAAETGTAFTTELSTAFDEAVEQQQEAGQAAPQLEAAKPSAREQMAQASSRTAELAAVLAGGVGHDKDGVVP
jgi:recombination protein RecT